MAGNVPIRAAGHQEIFGLQQAVKQCTMTIDFQLSSSLECCAPVDPPFDDRAAETPE